MKEKQTNKGITLVALVITVIVLLILATVAINGAINSDGLFGKAEEAAENWNTTVGKEENQLNDLMGKLIKRKITVKSNLEGKAYVFAGTELILTAVIEGYEGLNYVLQWQQSSDNGVTWTDIPGANRYRITFYSWYRA